MSRKPPAVQVVEADRVSVLEIPDAAVPIEASPLVQAYQRASKADATVRAYITDGRLFDAWCRATDFRAMPASPLAVAEFLVAEAEAGKAVSTIGRPLHPAGGAGAGLA